MFKPFAAALWVAWAMGVGSAAAAPKQVQPVPPQRPADTQVVKADLPSKKARKKTKVKPVTEPVQYAPSGEALSAREKRLRRECKGRPNAGACLGHAS